MSRSITQPPDTIDAYSAIGDVVVGHTPEQAQAYRQAAQEAARRQQAGLPPSNGRQAVTAPTAPPLPSVQVARQVLGHEIARLSLQAEALARQADGQQFAYAGNTNPYIGQVVQAEEPARAQARDELARVRDELARLEGLDDGQAAVWARDYQATTPGRVR